MKTAILCPGPSLCQTYPGAGYDLVIGINRAATAFGVDVWVASDLPLILAEFGNVIGNPPLFTRDETLDSLIRRAYQRPISCCPFSQLACPVDGWQTFTACAALVLAGRLGARRIHAYGADWNDRADFDGKSPPGRRRDAGRWEQERRIWDQVVEWVGVPVTRISKGKEC